MRKNMTKMKDQTIKNYPNLFERVYNTPLAIHPDKLSMIENVFRGHLLQMDGLAFDAKHGANTASSQSYHQAGNIAIIPIYGTLVQRTGGMDALSGLTSYQSIRSDLSQAMNDKEVKAIMLDIDSSGGEVAGLFDLVDVIKQANAQKPIWAIANEAAFSAAYAIASACERIVMPRTAAVGSIGVIAMHVDQSQKDLQDGYQYTAIHAGSCKADGNPHFPLSDDAKARLQVEVNRLHDLFVGCVAQNRDLQEAAVRATEARWYASAEAITLGLADEILTIEGAVHALSNQINVKPIRTIKMETDEEIIMDKQALLGEIKMAERERIAGILNHEAAEGRNDLAKSLALETDLNLDAAVKVLSSAPKQSVSFLSDAMAHIDNPDVGADGEQQDDDPMVGELVAGAFNALGFKQGK